MRMTTSQLVTGVDFVGVPTHNLEAAVEFYGETLGLARSVYLKERNYAEFETGNLTLSVIDAEAMGLEHHPVHNVALHVEDVQEARTALEDAAWPSRVTPSTQASVTWRSLATPTGTR